MSINIEDGSNSLQTIGRARDDLKTKTVRNRRMASEIIEIQLCSDFEWYSSIQLPSKAVQFYKIVLISSHHSVNIYNISFVLFGKTKKNRKHVTSLDI